MSQSFHDGSPGKESAYNAEDEADTGLIARLGRSPGVGNGKPLLYSCLENAMDRGAWRAIVHRVAKIQTRLSDGAGSKKYCESEKSANQLRSKDKC